MDKGTVQVLWLIGIDLFLLAVCSLTLWYRARHRAELDERWQYKRRRKELMKAFEDTQRVMDDIMNG